jgi:alpha-tubulin suppressor-like RCC1 family protein
VLRRVRLDQRREPGHVEARENADGGFFPEPVVQVSASSYGWHSCAVTVAGNLYCWGNNLFGQLGDGTTTTRESPVRVVEPH